MQSHTRKRVGRAGVVAGFAFALVPFIGISPAHACSCVAGTDEDHLKNAEVVFKGTVEAVTDPPGGDVQSSADPVIYTFDVSRTYKGAVMDPQKVRTAQSSASCGLSLSGAGPFLVFASVPGDGTGEEAVEILDASLCGGTHEIAADEDPSFGPGEPVGDETDGSETDADTTSDDGSDDGSDQGNGGLLETLLARLLAVLGGLLGDTRAN